MKAGHRVRHHLRTAIVCFSHSWGGLEIMVSRIAGELTSRGHSILLISPGGSPLEEEARSRGILHYALTPRFKYGDLLTARELSLLYRHHGVQSAIATLSKDISTLVLAKWIHSQSHLLYFQQMQFGHPKRDFFHRITYRELDSWITLTKRMKVEVGHNTVVPANRISVIPFGIDIRRFDPKKYSKTRSRRTLHLPARELLVGLIGRIDKQKGHEDLFRAAPTVLQSVPKTTFLIVGEETKGESGYGLYVRQLAKELGVEQKIRFMPFTKDIPLVLSALDVLAVPSHSETFGYVAVEAMAMGVPVVGTNAGGLPEIIEDGKTGYLVPSNDPSDLADRIIRLLGTPSLRTSMGRKGRTRAQQDFNFQKHVTLLEQLVSATVRAKP